MSLMHKLINRGMVFDANAVETGGAGASSAASDVANSTPAAANGATDTASLLYPDDKPAQADASAPAGDTPADAGAWKEYEPDPAKSDADNAAAKAEHDKGKPAIDPLDLVPEDGKYTLTMPEGVTLDAELLDALGPEFKEAGLTPRQAQKLADKFIEKQRADYAKQSDAWKTTVEGWADKAKNDPEIGGAKWDKTAKDASSLVNRFGTPELKTYLNSSGGGNHPELIRFMAKVGAMIGEDNPAISENRGQKTTADAAERLYPNDQPKGKN